MKPKLKLSRCFQLAANQMSTYCARMYINNDRFKMCNASAMTSKCERDTVNQLQSIVIKNNE